MHWLWSFVFITATESCFTTENLPCQLPFQYKEVTYNGCTDIDSIDGEYWCPTHIHENGSFSGQHGSCRTDCPKVLSRKPRDVVCGRQSECVPQANCPDFQNLKKKFQTLGKNTREYKEKLIELKNRVCNRDKKWVCCLRNTNPDSMSWLPGKGNCGINPELPPQRVFGGEKTNPGMFPFTALLGYQVYKKKWVEQIKAWRNGTALDYECGGTLINKWFVLTAAHCHQKRKPIASVRLGDWWVGNGKMRDCDGGFCLPPVQDFDITSADVIVHEDFRYSHNNVINDIALIRLPRKAELNLGVQIVCLPLKAAEFTKELNVENLQEGLEGSYPNVVGWGYSKDYDPYNDAKQGDFDTNNVASAYQQRLDVQVISSSECFQRLDVETLDTQLCAGGRVGQDACKVKQSKIQL